MSNLTVGTLLLVGAVSLLYFLEYPPWGPERHRNLKTSPDWDEAWLRLQQAEAYYLVGGMGHVRLRLIEAMHHADQLPEAQRHVVLEKINELAKKVG